MDASPIEIFGVILLIALVFLTPLMLLSAIARKLRKPRICASCGSRTGTRLATRGSLWIEIVLWLFFLVPGLIYSIWRHASRQEVCRVCGSAELVPVDSPRGRELVERFSRSGAAE